MTKSFLDVRQDFPTHPLTTELRSAEGAAPAAPSLRVLNAALADLNGAAMGSDQLAVHQRIDEETVAMGWFEHGVEVPVEAGTARTLFTDAPDQWLPPVVGIRALHEVETVSPLRIFGLARFRIGDSWRNGAVVSRPIRIEFGREPFRPALVVLDGELIVAPSEHGGTFVRFRGERRARRRGVRRAVDAALAGAAVRGVVDAVANRLQLVAAQTPDVEVPSCSTC